MSNKFLQDTNICNMNSIFFLKLYDIKKHWYLYTKISKIRLNLIIIKKNQNHLFPNLITCIYSILYNYGNIKLFISSIHKRNLIEYTIYYTCIIWINL